MSNIVVGMNSSPAIKPHMIDCGLRNTVASASPACFTQPPLGQLGSAPRRFFYGPGIENFDLALIKRMRFASSDGVEIRLEAFNAFNHPQFYGPGAVDGNIVSPTFGEITAAQAPRFIQIAGKVSF